MKTAKQDLLMFLGTRAEVDKVESINKCMYFAWDTGEFFLGTNHGTKTRYGGSRNSLSKTDILILLEKELETSRLNASTAVGIANRNSETLQASIRALNAEMTSFKNNMVEELGARSEEILNRIQLEIITTDKLNTALANYYTSDEVDNTFLKKNAAEQGFMQFLTGAEIASRVLSLDGVYFCTSSYQNTYYNLKGGSIYKIFGGQCVELAVNGSGGGSGGGVSTSAVELFTVNGKEEIISFSEDAPRELTVKIITAVPTEIKSATLYYDMTSLGSMSIVGNTNTSTFYIPDETTFTLGEHSIRLQCVMKSGLTISNVVKYYIVRPIYYGVGSSATPILDSLTKATAAIDPTGDYTVTTTKTLEYIWFAYPINLADEMIVDKDQLMIRRSIPGLPCILETHGDYQYIRTAYAILPGTWKLAVFGKSGAR